MSVYEIKNNLEIIKPGDREVTVEWAAERPFVFLLTLAVIDSKTPRISFRSAQKDRFRGFRGKKCEKSHNYVIRKRLKSFFEL